MDLEEPITLSSNGHVLTLPLINLMRITIIKMMPLMLQFQQETGKSDLVSFQEWMKERLGMKGKNVLL